MIDNDYEYWEIGGHFLEFIPSTHTYLCDGIEVISITQLLKYKFGNMYAGVSQEVLEQAGINGTAMHEAIERYETYNEESNLKELHNYKFLKKHYKWKVIECEVPVILFRNDVPIACGRLDQIIKIGKLLGVNDLKRTSVLQKEYVTYQTNLYRIAYRQTYGIECDFVSVTHLREDKRRFLKLPVDENMTWKLIEEYLEKRKESEL